jgi:hypothetical protein
MRPPRGQGARSLCRRVAVLAGAVTAAFALAGCASSVTEMPDSPSARTERSAAEYPAVHDLPPARAERALTDAEQVKLQQELAAASQSQTAKIEAIERADVKPADPAPAEPKRPPRRQAAGTRPNP